jgi:hypothetical protein
MHSTVSGFYIIPSLNSAVINQPFLIEMMDKDKDDGIIKFANP